MGELWGASDDGEGDVEVNIAIWEHGEGSG